MWLAVLLILLGALVLARMAFADEPRTTTTPPDSPRPTAVQLALALDVARTAVNEASLAAGRRDVDMIYEATRFHGGTDGERLDWLRRHSRCANPMGDCNRDGQVGEADYIAAEARPGNAGWTRYLEWSGDEPANYQRRGRRRVWRADRWLQVRERALARVMADRPTRVCGVPIRTWGSRTDFEGGNGRTIALECGARNLGGTTPALARNPRARRAVIHRPVNPVVNEVELR